MCDAHAPRCQVSIHPSLCPAAEHLVLHHILCILLADHNPKETVCATALMWRGVVCCCAAPVHLMHSLTHSATLASCYISLLHNTVAIVGTTIQVRMELMLTNTDTENHLCCSSTHTAHTTVAIFI